MVPQVLVLADDMTGALEVGSAFAAVGIESAMSTALDWTPAADAAGVEVLVVDTETRHVDARLAHDRVFSLASDACRQGVRYLFKKTDSTLRGNVAPELAAAGAAWGGAPLFYIAAYPKLGRTVRRGVLQVDGVPVSETSFGIDRLNPVRESHIPTLLRTAGVPLPVAEIGPDQLEASSGTAFFVVDGVTDEDIRSCARSLARRAGPFVMAGPAGLAHHFAEATDLPRAGLRAVPHVRRCLIVNGSLHPASEDQVLHARSDGIPVVDPAAVAVAVDESGWAILRIPAIDTCDGLEFARTLGAVVAGVIEQADLDAVVVFGGDTAFGIVGALRNPVLRCVAEIEPGVPASLVEAVRMPCGLPGRERDLLLVTKAGGFGAPDVIARLRQKLTAARQ